MLSAMQCLTFAYWTSSDHNITGAAAEGVLIFKESKELYPDVEMLLCSLRFPWLWYGFLRCDSR
jgi:hypothetical protein